MPKQQQNVRILVAEDSPTQAEQLRYLLESSGYQVTVAANGREALAIARAQKPAVILSDVLMPELDGYAFCRELKSDPALSETPVILVTALSSPQDVMMGLDCGTDYFIRKPYEEDSLLSRIAHALANRDLRGTPGTRPGIEVVLSGERHFITSDRQQILDLLISTYEEAVRINDELISANRQLEARNREVERAGKFKDEFLSTMSHELRTPLQVVLGYCEVLLQSDTGELDDGQRRGIENINTAAQQLLRITNDILDLSRIEAGRMELSLETLPINHVVVEIVASLKPLADRKSQSLMHQVGPELLVRADPTRIRQVLTNLIGNAIKFTHHGGLIEVRAGLVGDQVRVDVQDNGTGIPSHERKRVLEAFYRLQQHQARVEGTGLGLAISHKLVEMHGGHLDIENRPPGMGSCFYFTLPAAKEGLSATPKTRHA